MLLRTRLFLLVIRAQSEWELCSDSKERPCKRQKSFLQSFWGNADQLVIAPGEHKRAKRGNSKSVIASEARQSSDPCAVIWRLLRHRVPRNDQQIISLPFMPSGCLYPPGATADFDERIRASLCLHSLPCVQPRDGAFAVLHRSACSLFRGDKTDQSLHKYFSVSV
jgi:hypothetical protein